MKQVTPQVATKVELPSNMTASVALTLIAEPYISYTRVGSGLTQNFWTSLKNLSGQPHTVSDNFFLQLTSENKTIHDVTKRD